MDAAENMEAQTFAESNIITLYFQIFNNDIFICKKLA